MIGEILQTPINKGWHLVIEEDGKQPRFETLGTIGEYAAGRNPERCKVVLFSQFTSRLHCMFVVHTDEHLTIRDTGSANGTWVNHARIETNQVVSLNHNDQVSVPQSLITVIRVP